MRLTQTLIGRCSAIQWHVPRGFVHARGTISLADLPPAMDGLRLLHLTDLHLGSQWATIYDDLIQRVANDPPDLILFTGDFVENRFDHRVGLPLVLRLFSQLKPRDGIYAILGNHDPQVMMPYLAGAGIRLITDQCLIVPTSRGPVELIGFPGPSRRDLDRAFLSSLPPRTPGLPRIILSHYPDLFDAAIPLDPDLYLAGHTHGGQICLPNGWPPLTHDRMPRRHSRGVHRIGRTWYAVSRGLGFTGVRLRMWCAPEVTEFVFQRSSLSPVLEGEG